MPGVKIAVLTQTRGGPAGARILTTLRDTWPSCVRGPNCVRGRAVRSRGPDGRACGFPDPFHVRECDYGCGREDGYAPGLRAGACACACGCAGVRVP